ncbi:unnamed protein product [Schistocephalus solidus]|uniref:RT_RNaseH domain-containing protein n=1 Tax=Schistocephalus solidus TaxID=70667 RepID=A0A183SS73_SCHSO|nr:unnamed protein product [Schistocephalus solidus]
MCPGIYRPLENTDMDWYLKWREMSTPMQVLLIILLQLPLLSIQLPLPAWDPTLSYLLHKVIIYRFRRELLVVYLAMKHFRHLRRGRNFTVFTDYKALSLDRKSNCDQLNYQQIRKLNYVTQFRSEICLTDGSHNK